MRRRWVRDAAAGSPGAQSPEAGLGAKGLPARVPLVLSALLLLSVAACSGSESETEAPPPSVRDYVALGDSYASGLGGGNYADTECYQSKDASYPQLWVKSRPEGTLGTVTDRTCAGARIADVRSTQLDAINADTGWVTLTVGGNDAGWVGSLQQCMLGNDQTCQASVRQATGTVESVLPDELDSLYTAIRKRAPEAKVFVLGYPHLVGPGDGCTMPDARRNTLNDGADKLVESIKSVVEKHDGFTFVDVREAFEGHEACTAEPWIHGVRDNLSESFHPNAEGFQAYAEKLAEVTG